MNEWKRHASAAAVAAAVMCVGPLLAIGGRPEMRTTLTLGGAVAISAIGYDLIYGLTRQLHLGHSFFVAAGAYSSGVLSTEFDVHPLLSLLLAVVLSALLSNVIGRLIFRLHDFHFAAATFALGLLGVDIIVNLREYTGGDDGTPVVPIRVGGWSLTGPAQMYAIVMAVGLLGVVIARNYRASPHGAAARLVGLDEPAAAAQGIDCVAVKVEVFTIGGAFAALGGALYGHLSSYLFIEQFGLLSNIQTVAVVVLGGAGTVVGPFVATLVYEALPDVMSVFDEYPDLATGVLLIGLLLGTDRFRHWRTARRRTRASVVVAPVTRSPVRTAA